jgi:hypothetical protein
MKPHHLTALLGGLLFTGLLIGTTAQHRQLAELRRDFQAQATTQTDSPSTVAVVKSAPVVASAPPTDAELKELLTLRRDVSQLRQQKPKLDKLRAENERLRAAVANPPQPGSGGGASGGFLAASKARFMGLATPADTLQSFLFAVRNRDTNVLFQVLAPDTLAKLTAQMEQQGAAQFLEGVGAIPGFLIKTVTETPEGTAEAVLQFDPTSESGSVKFPLERVNGEWKLKMP